MSKVQITSSVAVDTLPNGWTEAYPGGMACCAHPVWGGIVDSEMVSGDWFVIFNNDGISNMDGFASREEALCALNAALQGIQPVSSFAVGSEVEVVRTGYAGRPGLILEDMRDGYYYVSILTRCGNRVKTVLKAGDMKPSGAQVASGLLQCGDFNGSDKTIEVPNSIQSGEDFVAWVRSAKIEDH